MKALFRHDRTFVAWLALTALLILGSMTDSARAERIKDLASIAGVRSNQLVGYGLVIGLDGTGDRTQQTPFTIQSLISMLDRLGVRLPPGTNLQLNNVAAVMVHADLPPFAKPGQLIDVTVSSIGNADSLRGGSLVMTPLKGLDGNVYAMAQGSIVVGGLGISAQDGSSVSVGVPSVGRIPNGATVEREVLTAFTTSEHIILNLHRADFTTANRVANRINGFLGIGTAEPLDSASIRIVAPRTPAGRIEFVSVIENLDIMPGEAPARVVVNSRTGTVVISSNVRVLPAAVSHGTLVVAITEDFDVSQPQPFSRGGRTVVTPDSQIDITQEDNPMFLFEPGVELNDIVRAVNEVGATPGDLVAILEALKQAGALRANLIVI